MSDETLGRELEGLLVVSIEQAICAPYCGMLLADSGARVVKVERPEGDFARRYDAGANGESAIFAWTNRGKESICLDLNLTGDVAILRTMLRDADVFLHNLAPGALAKRGFSAATLHATNPRLICCEISGYGRDGDAAKKKAYDFLVQAESGLCAVTGTEAELARVGVSIVDISTGLTAYSAILRALIQRGRTGKGMDLSISMFDVMADWMNMALMAYRHFGGAPKRTGMRHAMIAPYGAYTCAAGDQVMIAIQSDREWQTFCTRVLDQPALGTDPRFIHNPERSANRDQLDEAIRPVFESIPRTTLLTQLENAGIACASLNTVADLDAHPFLRRQPVHYAGMTLSVADLPVQTGGQRPTHVPSLDEHGAAIRQEFAA